MLRQMEQASGSSRRRKVGHLGYMRADLLIVLDSFIKLPNILLMCSIVCLCIVLVMEVLQAPGNFSAHNKHTHEPEPFVLVSAHNDRI